MYEALDKICSRTAITQPLISCRTKNESCHTSFFGLWILQKQYIRKKRIFDCLASARKEHTSSMSGYKLSSSSLETPPSVCRLQSRTVLRQARIPCLIQLCTGCAAGCVHTRKTTPSHYHGHPITTDCTYLILHSVRVLQVTTQSFPGPSFSRVPGSTKPGKPPQQAVRGELRWNQPSPERRRRHPHATNMLKTACVCSQPRREKTNKKKKRK